METETLQFKGAGLSEGEMKIYSALLETGTASVSKIVEKTGLQESTARFVMEQLVYKGLVEQVVKQDMRLFEAGSPDRLLSYVKRKQEELKEEEQRIEKLVPLLYMKSNEAGKESQVKVFEGWTSIKEAYNELMKNPAPDGFQVFAVNPSPKAFNHFREFMTEYHKTRTKLKLPLKIMLNEEHRQSVGEDRQKEPLTEVRYVPKELSTVGAINLFGNKVLMPLWIENPIMFLIENKELADSFKSYFELLWKSAKK
jgi:sugar-specific transcriptional regulator TrmB